MTIFELSATSVRTVSAVARALGASGRSPRWYRSLVRRHFERLVYDSASNRLQVFAGPLAGSSKYGPFREGDAEFAAGRYEPQTVGALLNQLGSGHVACDIGANSGYHTLLMSKLVGEQGRVFAFEPAPLTAKWLLETIRRNRCDNVVVHEVALGDKSCRGELRYQGALDGCATLTGAGHGYYDNRPHDCIEVDVMSFDRWVEVDRIARIDLVKIDVEGAELAVLKGMGGVLSSLRPVVICELWGQENVAEGIRVLEAHEYRVTTLDRWSGSVDKRRVEIRNVLAVPSSTRPAIPS